MRFIFKVATVSALGSGESTLFWTDNWLQGASIRSLAPFAAVPKRRLNVAVVEALLERAWVHHITGPHTMRLLTEFINLWNMSERVQLQPGVPDTFAWRLMEDQQYSASSSYGAMFVGSSRPLGAKRIWNTSALPRVKFFFRIIMHGRCWTAHRRFRRGLQDNDTCIICEQATETMDHIILGGVFSREVWASCLRRYRLHELVVVQEANTMQWWTSSRKRLSKTVRRGFDSLFFLIGWSLWMERNARIFSRIAASPAQLSSPLTPRLLCGARRVIGTWECLSRCGVRSEDAMRLCRKIIYCIIIISCEKGVVCAVGSSDL